MEKKDERARGKSSGLLKHVTKERVLKLKKISVRLSTEVLYFCVALKRYNTKNRFLYGSNLQNLCLKA